MGESTSHEHHRGTAELGGEVDGERISLDRRMFVQFRAFGGCSETSGLQRELEEARIPAVLYEDGNDPFGIGIAVAYEQPDDFATEFRTFLKQSTLANLAPRPELTMFGRTYAIGYEKDLHATLLRRPIERLLDERLSWAVWYPLRRKGLYETLSSAEQHEVQLEHMQAGRSMAQEWGIKDIRLACHGLSTADDDFIVALLGPKLHALSMAIQRMRKTTQTAVYLESLGPFFFGRVTARTIEASMFDFSG